MFEIDEVKGSESRIKVFGIGGCGCNVINSIIAKKLSRAEFIAIDTGKKSLNQSLANLKVQIGKESTKGDGAGGNPAKGRLAALEDKEKLISFMEETDIVFIIAGMGRGTGAGAAPVIASLAKDKDILTIAAVVKPFYFEGKQRLQKAEEGLKDLIEYVDAYIVIPNDKINPNVQKGASLLKSVDIANDALRKVIAGILDVILCRGFINSDIADLRTIVNMGGRTHVGMGNGTGTGAAVEAAKKALSNPLLEGTLLDGAKGILVNITGGVGMSLDTIEQAASIIYDTAPNADIILGTVFDKDMGDDVRITLIAAGVDNKSDQVLLPKGRGWPLQNKAISFKNLESILSKKDIASLRVREKNKKIE